MPERSLGLEASDRRELLRAILRAIKDDDKDYLGSYGGLYRTIKD